jgi:hypothetical protein
MRSRPLCGPPDQGGRRTVERTTTLIRAMDKHRRDDRQADRIPTRDVLSSRPTGSERGWGTSVSAGQRLRGAPPPESNRRPHPYHGTTGNHCARRRFPRSHSTVGAEVVGSLRPSYAFSILATPVDVPPSRCRRHSRVRARSAFPAPSRCRPGSRMTFRTISPLLIAEGVRGTIRRIWS